MADMDFVESLCRQTRDGFLFLSDEMALKYDFHGFIDRELGSWTRDADLCGWVSSELNHWYLINNAKEPS